ncbi:MAG: type III pantothenate kinase [Gammaproteobacteria bacterium]|nr:type III pantothenate kinase [Gammaproteobacteria bacterium]MDH3506777.1 type III pantothenate kinase [Gammaproteobacteria bacterium]
MKIVADIGNTQIKWARVADGQLEEGGQAVHAGSQDAALEAVGAVLVGATHVVAANVAGEELAERLRACVAAQGAGLTLVKPAAEQFGVRCAYADPSRLGADRWVGVIGAHHFIEGAACVIDAGTTVTLDAVARDGQHLGGLILAGPEIVAAALSRETRGIGDTAPARSAPTGLGLLGASTNDAVAHGTMLGIAAGLDRAIAEIAKALGEPPSVVLTGGGATALESWLETPVSYRPQFVLEGLAYIASEL